MYDYVLVRSTICDTCTICKIQEHTNITNRMFVAQIDLSQIERSIFQIEHSICDTQLLFAKHRHIIETTTAYVKASEMKQTITDEVLIINNLVDNAILRSNGNLEKTPSLLYLKYMVYIKFMCYLDASMLDKRVMQPLSNFQFCLKLSQSSYDINTKIVTDMFHPPN